MEIMPTGDENGDLTENPEQTIRNENLVTNGRVTDGFRNFLETLSIEVPKNKEGRDDLLQLNDVLQEQFVKKVRGEVFRLRERLEEHFPSEEQYYLLQKLGVFNDAPLPSITDDIIIHGGSMEAIWWRLRFLLENIKKITITNNIYISVSNRQLLPSESFFNLLYMVENYGLDTNKQKLLGVKTEFEAAQALFENIKVTDKNKNKIQIEVVSIPDIPGANRSANTPYSMKHLFKEYGNQMSKTIVSLSSQPYIVNQQGIAEYFFPSKTIIPAGPALGTTKSIAFYANALSRMFYDTLHEPN